MMKDKKQAESSGSKDDSKIEKKDSRPPPKTEKVNYFMYDSDLTYDTVDI